MKEKIAILIIGALIGAVITAAVFLVLKQNTPGLGSQMQGMDFRSGKGEFIKGQMKQNGETPETIPNVENGNIEPPTDGNMQPPAEGQMPENMQKQDKTNSQSKKTKQIQSQNQESI